MSILRRRTYGAARAMGDVEALASGDPERIARRAKNRILGRLLSPIFRQLWR